MFWLIIIMDCWAVNGVLREHGEWLKLPRFGGVSGNEAIKYSWCLVAYLKPQEVVRTVSCFDAF